MRYVRSPGMGLIKHHNIDGVFVKLRYKLNKMIEAKSVGLTILGLRTSLI